MKKLLLVCLVLGCAAFADQVNCVKWKDSSGTTVGTYCKPFTIQAGTNVTFEDDQLTRVMTINAGESQENIRFADQFSGADAGAKIAAAVADLPSTCGTVDARSFEGAQTIGTTVTVNKCVKLLLGGATYSVASGAQILVSGNDATIEGIGDASLIDCKEETSTTVCVKVTGSRGVLKNLKVQGSRATSGGAGAAVTVQFSGGTRGTVENVTITKAGSHGIQAIAVSDFHVNKSKISDVGGSCVWTEGDRDGEWIEDNNCDLAAQTTLTQAGGIHIKSGSSRNITDVHILRNRVTNSGSTGIVSNSTSYRNQNIEIAGNTIDTTGTRVAVGIAGEGMAITGDHIRILDTYMNKAGEQGILLWGTVTATQVIGGSIKNSSFITAGHAAIELVPTTNDTSGDGAFRKIFIAGIDCSDDASGTQLRPIKITKDTGGTYAANNTITGISGTGNLNTGVDFGTDAASWDAFGSNLPGVNSVFRVKNAIAPESAGGATAGTAALPYSSVFVGAAATNNSQITGTFTAARVHTLPDITGNIGVYLSASDAAVDLASVASAACTSERTVAVTGAAFGDAVDVMAATALEAGSFLSGKVSSSGNIKWQFCNLSGGAIDRASDTYSIRVRK